MSENPRKICVIVNPVSGLNRTALRQIEEFFAARPHIQAQIHETHADGDARRFASEAAAAGCELVAAYGGDGTMMEVADGLRGTGIPMAMLPGGTANVMAIELGVPTTLQAALALTVETPATVRPVDMGVLDQKYFLLRAGIGYEAEMSAQTERGEKSKSGRLAYFRNAIRKMRNLRQTRYIVTVDGVTHIHHGITCMICNSANIGVPNLRLVRDVDVSDGLLDVIIIASMRPGNILRVLVSIVLAVLPIKSRPSLIAHWQGRHITVESKRPQLVARDGEILKRAKRVTAQIVPHTVGIIVPMAKEMGYEGALDNAASAGGTAASAGAVSDLSGGV